MNASVVRSYRWAGPMAGQDFVSPEVLSRTVWECSDAGIKIPNYKTPEGYTKGLLSCYLEGSPCTIEELEKATGISRADILGAIG